MTQAESSNDEVAQREEKLRPFRDRGRQKKLSKPERQALMRKQFPSTEMLNWSHALREDNDLFARIMRDILKLDQREPGRSGPRRTLDYERGVESFRQIMGEDYSVLPFDQALRVLAGTNSMTILARKSGLSRMNCNRIIRGLKDPTMEEMESIAKAFGKKPSYFMEYRSQFITSVIADRLANMPESSIAYYRKMFHVDGG